MKHMPILCLRRAEEICLPTWCARKATVPESRQALLLVTRSSESMAIKAMDAAVLAMTHLLARLWAGGVTAAEVGISQPRIHRFRAPWLMRHRV